jgi:hypothetical protein
MDRIFRMFGQYNYNSADPLKPPMWNDGEDKYATGAKWRKKPSRKIESKSEKKKRRKKGRR